MKTRNVIGALSAAAIITSASLGDIQSLELPFQGDITEGFEQYEIGDYPSLDVFDGSGFVAAIGQEAPPVPEVEIHFGVTIHGIHVQARSGVRMLGTTFSDDVSPAIRWNLTQPALMFGGFFATNNLVPDATAFFYDEDNNFLGQQPLFIPNDGNWVWQGWETTGAGIARIDFFGNGQFGPGFIFYDDMDYIPIPAPASAVLLGAVGLIARRRRR